MLDQHYKITTDWSGKQYIGITLDWDYKQQQVHLSMPGYIKKILQQFQHQQQRNQTTPYPCAPIQYGVKTQYANRESSSPAVDNNITKLIQQVCGKFLFLGQAVNSTLCRPMS